MAHMTLPAAHSEADARLAERIGRALELEEVHVFWTLPVPAAAAPHSAAPAPPRKPAPERSAAQSPGSLIGALAALLGRLAPQRR